MLNGSMHRRAFFVAIFIYILYASLLTHAEGGEPKRTIPFERQKTTVPFEENNGGIRNRVVHSFRIPCLVEVDGVLVAIADARYDTSNDNSFIETVVKYSVDGGETWETQIAIKNSRASMRHSRVIDPTVIVKGNKIYLLVGSYYRSNTYWIWHTSGWDWEPLLAVGEVKKTTDGGKVNATITWSKPVSLRSVFPAHIAGARSKQFLGGVGVAITTTNGTLVFPVQATNMKKDIVSTIMLSNDNGSTWSFARGTSEPGCSEPVILEWEGKLIMNTRLDIGYRKVYESTDMGATWTEAVGTLSRVWGNSPSRGGPGSQSSFIAVTIDGMRVMLFTHPLNFKGRWERDRLHLWLTDNKRIFDVGQISHGDENAAYSSLLYTNDTLYCLHEINHGEIYSLVFAHLEEELRLIKSVIAAWKAQDEFFSTIRPFLDLSAQTSNDTSATAFPTAGLVGFLSANSGSAGWYDVYRCVNATVTKGRRVPNGLRFKGRGAGAWWPVKNQGQNQRYHFANYMFTLVATVSIERVPSETTPLLGASLDSAGNNVFGVSYDNDSHWVIVQGKRGKNVKTTETWELGRAYQVALTLQNGVYSVYIDGKLLQGFGDASTEKMDSLDIFDFFVGGSRKQAPVSYVNVTVANVLLYNRPLNSQEIKTVFLSRDNITVTSNLRLTPEPESEEPEEPEPEVFQKPVPTMPLQTREEVPEEKTSQVTEPNVSKVPEPRKNESMSTVVETAEPDASQVKTESELTKVQQVKMSQVTEPNVSKVPEPRKNESMSMVAEIDKPELRQVLINSEISSMGLMFNVTNAPQSTIFNIQYSRKR